MCHCELSQPPPSFSNKTLSLIHTTHSVCLFVFSHSPPLPNTMDYILLFFFFFFHGYLKDLEYIYICVCVALSNAEPDKMLLIKKKKDAVIIIKQSPINASMSCIYIYSSSYDQTPPFDSFIS